MNDSSEKETQLDAAFQKAVAVRLRKIGIVILLSGLLIAGVIFAFFPDAPSSDGGSMMTEYYKKQEVQVQGLWGNGGSLILSVTRSFSRPSTYAAIIAVVSVIVFLGCFYRASRPFVKSQWEK